MHVQQRKKRSQISSRDPKLFLPELAHNMYMYLAYLILLDFLENSLTSGKYLEFPTIMILSPREVIEKNC